jgi:hypothetical protein
MWSTIKAAMPWSAYTKNRFFAPKLSQLTMCGAPPLSITPEDSAGWLASFVLNSILRVNIPNPTRQLMFNYMRRIDTAVLEYGRGREALTVFIESGLKTGQIPISWYSRCLHSFEAAVAMTYQGYLLARQLIPGKPSLFEKNNGSVLDRMNRLYNASKHADEFIANGNRFPPGSTLPVWIINEGLESRDCVLTFTELAREIENLGTVAAGLAILDPATQPSAEQDGSTSPTV